ncbi:MAG: glycoside hydrolase domain-containing protein [Bacteroidales bacterium]
MKDAIPLKWILSGPSDRFTGSALQNEYYAFQIGVFASAKDIEELEVKAENLIFSGKSGEPEINLTCFNTQGVDPYGTSFTKKLNIQEGRVQALWIGADVPENAKPGKYAGYITIIGKYTQIAEAASVNLQASYLVRMDYDGYLKTLVTFKNLSKSKPIAIKDIRLAIPIVSGSVMPMAASGANSAEAATTAPAEPVPPRPS